MILNDFEKKCFPQIFRFLSKKSMVKPGTKYTVPFMTIETESFGNNICAFFWFIFDTNLGKLNNSRSQKKNNH